jgi:hypothetical protein
MTGCAPSLSVTANLLVEVLEEALEAYEHFRRQPSSR